MPHPVTWVKGINGIYFSAFAVSLISRQASLVVAALAINILLYGYSGFEALAERFV